MQRNSARSVKMRRKNTANTRLELRRQKSSYQPDEYPIPTYRVVGISFGVWNYRSILCTVYCTNNNKQLQQPEKILIAFCFRCAFDSVWRHINIRRHTHSFLHVHGPLEKEKNDRAQLTWTFWLFCLPKKEEESSVPSTAIWNIRSDE